jgi:chromosome segregation ATPase
VKSEKEVELESKLSTAHASLVAAQAEILQLSTENQSIRSATTRFQTELEQFKLKYDELVETSTSTLTSQQTALNKAHATELTQMRTQMAQQHTEMTSTIDQLKRDKADMQGMIHLLQQQISSSTSTNSSEQTELAEEKSRSLRVTAKVQELTTLMETTTEETRRKLDSQSQLHQTEMENLKSQFEHIKASMKLDHASELQQLRVQLEASGLKQNTSESTDSELSSLRWELKATEEQLSTTKEQLRERSSKVEELQSQLNETSHLLAEQEGKLKRSSEQTKTLQAQTSANFSQVEQMKQQVLRDRADLSKKLSLIAPETVRRIEQLQIERDTINTQFEDMAKSINSLSQQKNDILAKLASEVSKNSALVHQNSVLRHQLSLQISAFGATGTIIAPPSSSIQDLPIETVAEIVKQDATSTNTAAASVGSKSDPELVIVERNSIPEKATASHVPTTSSGKKRSTKPPRPHQHHISSSSISTTHSHHGEHLTHTAAAVTSSPHTLADENQSSGWLASVPLVGRMWRGEPQVRHTAHVEL